MIYCLCGVLRLVRYSIQKSSITFTQVSGEKYRFFTGLPIPAACCALVSLTLVLTSDIDTVFGWELSKIQAPALILSQVFLGGLMVSRWKFPAITHFASLSSAFRVTLVGLMVASMFWLYSYHPSLALLMVIWGYILSSLIRAFFYWLQGKKELAIADRWQWWT
jgi:phosphatidylserine synthase